MDQIGKLRNEIDIIDSTIMNLLETRFLIAKKIGLIKQRENITVLDTNREETILRKTTNYSHSPQIKNIYITIMNESKNIQRK